MITIKKYDVTRSLDNLDTAIIHLHCSDPRAIAVIEIKRNTLTNYVHISQDSIELLDDLGICTQETALAIEGMFIS